MGKIKKMNETIIRLEVQIKIKKDDQIKAWVVECHPFDVFSQGYTKEEAETNIKEAMDLFIESCFERGTIAKVIKKCRAVAYISSRPPEHTKLQCHGETEYLDIPITNIKNPFLASQS